MDKRPWLGRPWKESLYCPSRCMHGILIVCGWKKAKIRIYGTTWFWENVFCPDENGSWRMLVVQVGKALPIGTAL